MFVRFGPKKALIKSHISVPFRPILGKLLGEENKGRI